MDRLTRERKQLRRVFTQQANALEKKLSEEVPPPYDVKADLEILTEMAEKMFGIDSEIQNRYLDADEKEFNEKEFEKIVDEAGSYKRRWTTLRVRCEQKIEARNEEERQSESGSAVTAKSCRNLKLPKLELRKFDDDPKSWLGFWGQFRKIHEDTMIADDDKFQYLVQAMKEDSNARELVESFPPSGVSYHKALEHLKSRFAREEVLVETYVRELLRLVLCQAKGEYLLDTRSLYDKLMTYLQALETLGVSKDKYEAMLYPLVESALPENILLAWSRAQVRNTSQSDQLNQLLMFLRNEVEAEERIRLSRSEFTTGPSSSSYDAHRESKNTPTAACIVATEVKEQGKQDGKEQILCFFCSKTSHTAVECNKARNLTLDEKIDALKKNAACFSCLKKGHLTKFCKGRAFLNCMSCGKRHHVVMCPDLHKSKNDIPKQSPSPSSSQCICLKNKTTLLQTLVLNIENNGKVKKVRALLDSGSQRTYLASNVVDELKLKVVGTEALGHSLFGGVEKLCRPHRRVQVKVSSIDNSFGIDLTCLEQRKICGDLPKLNDFDLLSKLRNLNVNLTDLDCDETEIGLLIGCDYLGFILTDAQMIRLDDSLLAIKTKFGWTLQGPSRSALVDKTNTLFCSPHGMCDSEPLGIRDPIQREEARNDVGVLRNKDSPILKSNFEQALMVLQSVRKKISVLNGMLEKMCATFQELSTLLCANVVPLEPKVRDVGHINSNEKRINWPVGIVKEINPGADGHARVVPKAEICNRRQGKGKSKVTYRGDSLKR